MKPKTNLDVAHKVDIEKNLEVDIQARSKSTILLITFFELACIIFLMHHREYIDSLHQMLNSILMGMFTAGFAQSVIQLYRYVNYHRLAKFYVWGAVNGVISSLWIDYLVYNFPAVSMRVAVDQCIGSPFFQAIFIIYNCIWENLDILPAFKTTFMRMLLSCYMIWPICSIVSFNFLPTFYIFPFNCFVNVIWTVVVGILI